MSPKNPGLFPSIPDVIYAKIAEQLPPACCFMLYNTNQSLRSLEKNRYKKPPDALLTKLENNPEKEIFENIWKNLPFAKRLHFYSLSYPNIFDDLLNNIHTIATTNADFDGAPSSLRNLFAKCKLDNTDVALLYATEGLKIPNITEILLKVIPDPSSYYIRNLTQSKLMGETGDTTETMIAKYALMLHLLKCEFTSEQVVRFAHKLDNWYTPSNVQDFKYFFSLLKKIFKKIALDNKLGNKKNLDSKEDLIKFITSIKRNSIANINFILLGLLQNLNKAQALDDRFSIYHLNLLQSGKYKFEDIIIFSLHEHSITEEALTLLDQLIQMKRIRLETESNYNSAAAAATASSASASTASDSDFPSHAQSITSAGSTEITDIDQAIVNSMVDGYLAPTTSSSAAMNGHR